MYQNSKHKCHVYRYHIVVGITKWYKHFPKIVWYTLGYEKSCNGPLLEELSNFFETPIDFEKIKTHCNNFVAIHSDNDPYVPLNHGYIFKEKLGAKLIIKHQMGHFSGANEGTFEACTSLPQVTQSILEMSE